MKLIPSNSNLLCKLAVKENEDVSFGVFKYNKQNFPEYQIIDISKNLDGKYSIGDLIIINSIPTKFRLEDGNDYFLVKDENVIAKVMD